MKFLIVVMWLVAGEPRGGDAVGLAETRESCQTAAVSMLMANKERVAGLLAQGVEPMIVCADIESELKGRGVKFKPYTGPTTKL